MIIIFALNPLRLLSLKPTVINVSVAGIIPPKLEPLAMTPPFVSGATRPSRETFRSP
jgi:hypothetical protein